MFAYGLAMFCGVIYGPVHALMPFLLLGNSHIIIKIIVITRPSNTKQNTECMYLVWLFQFSENTQNHF